MVTHILLLSGHGVSCVLFTNICGGQSTALKGEVQVSREHLGRYAKLLQKGLLFVQVIVVN